MSVPSTVETLHRRVLHWYSENARDLPWRHPSTTAWGVFVSEIMAQQTPVARVAGPWRQWMDRWPTPADLAAASPADVVRAWGRLGYPRRALRLRDAAGAIVERHGGEVPADEASLLALPGVGVYTAAAVAAFAFGLRTTVVDTNVRRVQARAVGGAAAAAPSLTAAEMRRAEALVPESPAQAATWNVAVMELGALICTARAPRCEDCPIRQECAWVAAGSPPDAGPARRGQSWEGTDRQVRGRILAVLRDNHEPVAREDLIAVAPDASQAERCLAGLIHDGLADEVRPGWVSLPA